MRCRFCSFHVWAVLPVAEFEVVGPQIFFGSVAKFRDLMPLIPSIVIPTVAASHIFMLVYSVVTDLEVGLPGWGVHKTLHSVVSNICVFEITFCH